MGPPPLLQPQEAPTMPRLDLLPLAVWPHLARAPSTVCAVVKPTTHVRLLGAGLFLV